MDEATHKKNYKPITLRDMFMDKNPALGRWVPRFVFRILSRMLRIDFFNYPLLYEHGYKKDVDFARASKESFNVTVDVRGREHLVKDRRFIFASNHPLGGFDGMMIMVEIGDSYPHMKVLVNDLLAKVNNMDGTFVPINKHGAQGSENVRRISAIFESDEQVMTFPAGLVSRRIKGLVRDPEWQKSIIVKAKSSKRDIIPIHMSGGCSNFFYNLSNFRKFLGIKANLEMFFLPNETYKHRNKHYTLTFGKPIPYGTFDKRFTPIEWAQLVKAYVYIIAEDPDMVFSYIQN